MSAVRLSMAMVARKLGSCLFHSSRRRGSALGASYTMVEWSSLLSAGTGRRGRVEGPAHVTRCPAAQDAPLIKDADGAVGTDGAEDVAPARREGDVEHLLVVRNELYNSLLALEKRNGGAG